MWYHNTIITLDKEGTYGLIKKDWQCLKCHRFFYKKEMETKKIYGIITDEVFICPKCGGRMRYTGYIVGDKRNNYCLNNDSRYFSYARKRTKED